MVRICSACSGMSVEDLKEALLGKNIEDMCVGTCGMQFSGYVSDELIEASSQEEFIEKAKSL